MSGGYFYKGKIQIQPNSENRRIEILLIYWLRYGNNNQCSQAAAKKFHGS